MLTVWPSRSRRTAMSKRPRSISAPIARRPSITADVDLMLNFIAAAKRGLVR